MNWPPLALSVLMVTTLTPRHAAAAPRVPGKPAAARPGQGEQQPLAKDEIKDLVDAGMDSAVLAKKVEKLGINFAPTEEYLQSLKTAGAEDVLIQALRNVNPKPLSREKVLKLVAGGVPIPRAVALVKQYGLDFMADDRFIHTLRVAGADDALIAAVRAASKGQEVAPTAGTARDNSRDGLKYVWIPAGTFSMGCSPGDTDCLEDEKPPHAVTLTNGFWMGQTEITVGAYKRFVAEAGHAMPAEPIFNSRKLNPGLSNTAMPMMGLSWSSAQDYCSWAGGRLPTEAEWEYAARGGTNSPRYGEVDDIAWTADNSGTSHLDSTPIWRQDQKNYFQKLDENGDGYHEVAQKQPNPYGLFDILGNASEWVRDWYDAHYYEKSPAQDPPGPGTGTQRVLRSWNWFSSPYSVRASHRGPTDPTTEGNACSARCVLPAIP